MSIAKNHLSNAASKGRNGDDRLLFFSDGRIEHGNIIEEKMMGDSIGERLVDSIGSKTINPETGLKENFIGIALGAAAFGTQLVEGSAQKRISRQTGADQADLMSSKLGALDVSLKASEELATAQKQVLDFENQLGMKNLSDSFSTATLNNENQNKSNIANSGGLRTSSKINKDKILNEDKINSAFQSTNEKVRSEYGKKIGAIEADLEVKKEQYKVEKENTEAQFKMYDRQANQKGFFSNLGSMITGG